MADKQWSDIVESRKEQRRKKRQAVIQAGASLFIENGFEKTSLDDLAMSLGITKRTIYYYVQSKDEILMECIRQSMEVLERLVDDSENSPQSAVQKIESIVQEYARWITTDFGAVLVLTRENMLNDEVRLELRAKRTRLDWLVRNAISAGIAAGEISETCDPRLTSAAIFGALNWVPFWNRGKVSTPADNIASQFNHAFVRGMLR